MREWLNTMFGTDGARAVQMLAALLAVVALIVLVAWIMRRVLGGRSTAFSAGKSRARLSVVDAANVDGRRRLVLVRRDDVEHLVMVGGPNDVLLESRIVRSQPVPRMTPQRPADQVSIEQPLPVTPPRTDPSPTAPQKPSAVAADLKATLKESRRRAEAPRGTDGEPDRTKNVPIEPPRAETASAYDTHEGAEYDASETEQLRDEPTMMVDPSRRPGPEPQAYLQTPRNMTLSPPASAMARITPTAQRPTMPTAQQPRRPAPAQPSVDQDGMDEALFASEASVQAVETPQLADALNTDDAVAGEIERALADLATAYVPARSASRPSEPVPRQISTPGSRQMPAAKAPTLRPMASQSPAPAAAQPAVAETFASASTQAGPAQRAIPQAGAETDHPTTPPSAIESLGSFARQENSREKVVGVPQPGILPPIPPRLTLGGGILPDPRTVVARPQPQATRPALAQPRPVAPATSPSPPTATATVPTPPTPIPQSDADQRMPSTDGLEEEMAKLLSELSGPQGR